MSALLHSQIASFAIRFAVEPQHAYVLPALFDRVAAIAARPVASIVRDTLYGNRALGEYIAVSARKVALADLAGE